MRIPDIGDYTIKKVKRDKSIPVPDSIIEDARIKGKISNSIDPKEGKISNLNEIGEARNTLLSIKLDKVSDSVTGQTNVDPKAYETDLNALSGNLNADIADFQKARKLYASLVNSDPKNIAGWMGAARVEELDGKLQTARNILAQALQENSGSEDL